MNIIFDVSLFLALVIQVIVADNIVQFKPFHESILCRSCGHGVSSTENIVSLESPAAPYSFYDTIFNPKQDVLVHVMVTDFLIVYYPVVTFRTSNCAGIGEWDNSSWFPGYLSRPCVCPECGSLIGWEYKPTDSELDDSDFFGLILTNIIGETFADSLVKLPNIRN